MLNRLKKLLRTPEQEASRAARLIAESVGALSNVPNEGPPRPLMTQSGHAEPTISVLQWFSVSNLSAGF